jgi:hypothetical protein
LIHFSPFDVSSFPPQPTPSTHLLRETPQPPFRIELFFIFIFFFPYFLSLWRSGFSYDDAGTWNTYIKGHTRESRNDIWWWGGRWVERETFLPPSLPASVGGVTIKKKIGRM